MCAIIICFTSLLFITVMIYFYLVLADSNNTKKMRVTKEDIANCKARILVLEYMEKHNIDTLNIDDILNIFPINYKKGEEND